MPHQLRILKINLSILTIKKIELKIKKKTHEFRSDTLIIKNTEEHKPKKKKSYKPKKSNIRT